MSDVYQPRFLKQTAVYWPPAKANAKGEKRYGDAVQIKCRWTSKQQLVTTKDGREITSTTYILADRDIDIEGVLWLGFLSNPDLDVDVPFNNVGAMRVQTFDKIPDEKGRKFVRKAFM